MCCTVASSGTERHSRIEALTSLAVLTRREARWGQSDGGFPALSISLFLALLTGSGTCSVRAGGRDGNPGVAVAFGRGAGEAERLGREEGGGGGGGGEAVWREGEEEDERERRSM